MRCSRGWYWVNNNKKDTCVNKQLRQYLFKSYYHDTWLKVARKWVYGLKDHSTLWLVNEAQITTRNTQLFHLRICVIFLYDLGIRSTAAPYFTKKRELVDTNADAKLVLGSVQYFFCDSYVPFKTTWCHNRPIISKRVNGFTRPTGWDQCVVSTLGQINYILSFSYVSCQLNSVVCLSSDQAQLSCLFV